MTKKANGNKGILHKRFRCNTAIPYIIYNDVQPGSFPGKKYIYIFIYNEKIASHYFSDTDNVDKYINLNNDQSIKFEPINWVKQTVNLIRSIESGNDLTVKEYQIKNNIITITESSNDDQINLRFKGEVLLEGDAIRGVFYNEGKQVTPMRVYYNVDKPLPDPLLPDNNINV